jgi:SAM-dependent methyltransferase
MQSIRDYYAQNPLMVSSPFGGVDSANFPLLDAVLTRLGIDVSGKHVLDVGCGRGFVGDYLARRQGRYTAMDIVASRPGLSMAVADAASIPFASESFDAVFCIDAFEHFPEPALSAREFRRVLRPGGFVFLSVPNYANAAGAVKWWCERLGGYDRDTWAPFRHWQPQVHESMLTPGRVRALFRDAGFRHMRRVAHGEEVLLGMLPWAAHRRCPEAILFRLQRLFSRIGSSIASACPSASLHNFWKIEA